MGVSANAVAAYDKYKKGKKAKDYYSAVSKIIEEDTRSEGILKLGVLGLKQIGEKVFGKAFSKHPYFAYHKVHLEVLGKALTASDTHENAMKALHGAIASADATAVLTKQLTDLNHRKQLLKLRYAAGIAGSLQLISERNPAVAAAQMRGAGHTATTLRSRTEDSIYGWRAEICELYFDGADLLAMVDIEYRAAAAAFKRYSEKVKKLQESNNSLDRIAGLGAVRKQQYEWIEREMNRGSKGAGAPEAVLDPSAYAKQQRDKVEAVVQTLATLCDAAMSDEAYNPARLTLTMRSL